jgi:hypothetical protein
MPFGGLRLLSCRRVPVLSSPYLPLLLQHSQCTAHFRCLFPGGGKRLFRRFAAACLFGHPRVSRGGAFSRGAQLHAQVKSGSVLGVGPCHRSGALLLTPLLLGFEPCDFGVRLVESRAERCHLPFMLGVCKAASLRESGAPKRIQRPAIVFSKYTVVSNLVLRVTQRCCGGTLLQG